MPITSLKRIEVEQPGKFGLGAGKGFLIGAGVGIILVVVDSGDSGNSDGLINFSGSGLKVAGVLLCGLAGAAFGALIGPSEEGQWIEVPLDRLGMSKPLEGGLMLTVSFKF